MIFHFKKLRRMWIVLLLFSISLNISAFTYISYGVGGHWSNWKIPAMYELSGKLSDLVLYYYSDHPSVYVLRMKIDNYTTPSKEEIKKHYKNNSWFEYNGSVEYWVSDSYPTIQKVLQRAESSYGCNLISPPNSRDHSMNDEKKVKRTATALIKLKISKKGEVEVINIFFDGVGIGISWGDELR